MKLFGAKNMQVRALTARTTETTITITKQRKAAKREKPKITKKITKAS